MTVKENDEMMMMILIIAVVTVMMMMLVTAVVTMITRIENVHLLRSIFTPVNLYFARTMLIAFPILKLLPLKSVRKLK